MHAIAILWLLVMLVPANSQELGWVRPSIVKLQVETEGIVLDSSGQDICPKKGTGLIIADRFVATAAHVVTPNEDCGQVKRILATSPLRRNKDDLWIMTERGKSGADVALLELSEGQIPLKGCVINGKCYCAIPVHNVAVTAELPVVAFGIAAPMSFVQDYSGKIRVEGSDYYINVYSVEGYSGGPVLVSPGVLAGLVSERVEGSGDLSRIAPVGRLFDLLKDKNISLDEASFCNPSNILSYEISGIIFGTEDSPGAVIELERDIAEYSAETIENLKSAIKEATGAQVYSANGEDTNNSLVLELSGENFDKWNAPAISALIQVIQMPENEENFGSHTSLTSEPLQDNILDQSIDSFQ